MTINYGRNKLMIARHEAGHAIAARVLGINIKYATLVPVGNLIWLAKDRESGDAVVP
jgi:ATP-dependent Zn protease